MSVSASAITSSNFDWSRASLMKCRLKTAHRERQRSALAAEGKRSADIFSVTGNATKRECIWRHTKRF